MQPNLSLASDHGAAADVLAPGVRRVIAAASPGGLVHTAEATDDDLGIVHDDAGCWEIRPAGDELRVGRAGHRFRRLLIGDPVVVGARGATLQLSPTTDDATIRPPDVRGDDEAGVPVDVDAVVHAAGSGSLVLSRLTVQSGAKVRLDAVDLELTSGRFLAILGTSGAGKSTLLKAITGVEPATSGIVRFGGEDLYATFEQARRNIGYVPQDDILHTQLTVRDTLSFASRLRFPSSTPEDVRAARIQAVIDELGLTERADARVDQLSGGQRKRVNVAVELLTEPELLILDEPTSGLDPGNERALMELLRELANGGRMVIVVTHSIESLFLCDQVLFLARGGIPVYLGEPDGLNSHVGADELSDVFSRVDGLHDPSVLRIPQAPEVEDLPAGERTSRPTTRQQLGSVRPGEIGRQFRIMTERYLKVMLGDRRNLLLIAAQAPILALLMLAVFGSDSFTPGAFGVNLDSGNVLMALVLAIIYLGASNAVREVVKERTIVRREQNFGMSILAYLGSKVVVLSAITVMQAVVLVLVGTARQGGPEDALVLGSAKLELVVMVAACGLSAMCLGLLLSSVVKSSDKAMTLLPVTLFIQFLLAGLVFPLKVLPVQVLSWFTSARWGFAGVSATADFWTLRGCDDPDTTSRCSKFWQHEPGMWWFSLLMLLALGIAMLVLAWRSIQRADPVEMLAVASGERQPPVFTRLRRRIGR